MPTCSKCKKKEEDNVLPKDKEIFNCEACKSPVCTECANISGTEQRALIRSRRILIFYCPKCLNNMKLWPDMLSQINKVQATYEIQEEKQQKQHREIKDLDGAEKTLEDLKQDMSQLKEHIETVEMNCDRNQKGITDLNAEQNKINENYKGILTKINTIDTQDLTTVKKSYSDIVKQQTLLLDKLEDVEKNPAAGSPANPTPIIEELEDRQSRQKNILVFGIEESKAEGGQLRAGEDREKLEIIFEELTNTGKKYEFSLYRLGKYSELKIRPIKAIFKNKEDPHEILKLKNNLSEDTKKANIYIKYDQTPMQRKHLKDLLTELNEREKNEKNLKI